MEGGRGLPSVPTSSLPRPCPQQTARVARVAGGVVVDMSWGEPLAGTLRAEYLLVAGGDRMRVSSTLRMGGKQAGVASTYVRVAPGVSRSELLAQRRASMGSMEQVLAAQAARYGKD